MHKAFRSLLTSDRKRRRRTAAMALWLLRLLRDAEEADLLGYSDRLDCLEFESNFNSRHEFLLLEDMYIECEHSLGMLDSAIEDINYAY